MTGTSATFSGELSTTSGLISISGGGGAPPTGGVGFRTVTGRLIVYGGTSDITFQKNSNAGPNLTILESGAATFSSSVSAGGKIYTSASVNDNIVEVINSDTTNGYGLYVRAGGTASGRYVARFKNGADTDVMWIDKGGNVGIGTSSPSNKLSILSNGSTSTGADSTAGFAIYGDTQGSWITARKTSATPSEAQFGADSIGTFLTSLTTHPIVFRPANTEKMRLTSTGNLGLGTTTPDRDANTRSLAISGGQYAAASLELFGPSAYNGRNYIIFTGTSSQLIFYDLTASAIRMTIGSTGGIGAAGSTTNIYNPSDKRLKQNISTLTYGLDKVKALNPVKFNWADGFEPNEANKTLLGFIAQEVNEVIPEAIESFGGDINLNGKLIDNPLRVNEKFIIPVLVKAIQELSAKVSLLENK